jgi:RNA polymerase sigma-70 factor (ECF subfamily)
MMRNQEDAEEVLLEVFEQVWRTAPSFSAERGTVWRWLTVLVRSRAVDRMRTAAARRDQNRLSLSDEWGLISLDPQPDSVTILNQERLMIQSALQLLPGEQRQALEMAYFAGLTHVEIASELGVPLGTVKTRIRAAMDKLRISLSQRGLVVASESTR